LTRSRCRRGSRTSTRICASSASMSFMQRCASSSSRKTSPASCRGPRSERSNGRLYQLS
jgi:hypothetical protein